MSFKRKKSKIVHWQENDNMKTNKQDSKGKVPFTKRGLIFAIIDSIMKLIFNFILIFFAGALCFLYIANKFPEPTEAFIKPYLLMESHEKKIECSGDAARILLSYKQTSETLYQRSLDFLYSGNYSMCSYRDLLVSLHDNNGYKTHSWSVLKDVMSNTSLAGISYYAKATYAQMYADKLEKTQKGISATTDKKIIAASDLRDELKKYADEYYIFSEKFKLLHNNETDQTKTIESEVSNKPEALDKVIVSNAPVEVQEEIEEPDSEPEKLEETDSLLPPLPTEINRFKPETDYLTFNGTLESISTSANAVINDMFRSGKFKSSEMVKILTSGELKAGEEYPKQILESMLIDEFGIPGAGRLQFFADNLTDTHKELKSAIYKYIKAVSDSYATIHTNGGNNE
jgi:hypothetical protein